MTGEERPGFHGGLVLVAFEMRRERDGAHSGQGPDGEDVPRVGGENVGGQMLGRGQMRGRTGLSPFLDICVRMQVDDPCGARFPQSTCDI